MLLLGLDIGTSSCKAHLFEEDGRLLASACREYAVAVPAPGWAEQDAEKVWSLAQDAMREAIARARAGTRVVALGLSVQGEAVIPVDTGGAALRPAILGMDMRTADQNRWLEGEFGEEALYALTGMPILTVNTLPKLLWLKQNEPSTWAQARHFRLYEDFLLAKMTGRPLISHCLASRTQCYELGSGTWSATILDRIGLAPDRLSPLELSGVAAGPLHPGLAASLGLDPRRPPLVATGGHDAACGALGAGLTRAGLAVDSTGTAEVVLVGLARPAIDEALARAKVSIYRHVVPGMYLALTLNHSGGIVLRWFRDTFCAQETARARNGECDAYDLILGDADSGPSPVLFLPHLSGSGTPVYDSLSKGTVAGLTLATGRSDIARAIVEGLCFELRMHLETLARGGVTVEELRTIGGGARSPLWRKLKACITGCRVAAPAVTEAAGLGAAVLAGVAAGCYSGPAEAMRRIEPPLGICLPDAQRTAAWNERYELYRQLYPAVREINSRL